ncbi:ATP-binding protein [Paenarthrobacter sp. DKR-5]|uniref:ATP-binding protein n=1 Tax=Paenarthrobacter sp. DKR-5 TaxID=2835535 RepID=UPI001BDD3A7C|nr:ATP-binding protein [Paenarthrobacter sp. DKR-5]MBT1004434.1 ATP-binding protein [Paenarthrobacter sp. DKR-5]
MESRFELESAAEPQSLDAIHQLLQKVWDSAPGIDLMDRIRFETAVIEVASNIIEHSTPAEHGTVRFTLEVQNTPDLLQAEFQDDARAAGVDPGAAVMPDELAESGRGLALAKVALDQFGYARDAGRNRWTLLCRLKRRSGAS